VPITWHGRPSCHGDFIDIIEQVPQDNVVKTPLSWHWIIALGIFSSLALAGEVPLAKPKIAVFPLGGDAAEELRERCAFALRAKLDRDGHYEVIDGPRMKELAAEGNDPITAQSKPDAIGKLAEPVAPAILIWGELTSANHGAMMRLNILDLREKDPHPRKLEKIIQRPTDLRFVAEQVLETLPNITPFDHPTEENIQNDATAEELWKKNPNLVVNPDFSEPGHWEALYQSEKYPVNVYAHLPAVDKVSIYRMSTDNGKTNNVLAMNLSRDCAENNGLACLSDPIQIEPNTRYRLSFRYKSDGPSLHVFVKGYTTDKDIKGEKTFRENYRRQVPPTGDTKGQWIEVVDELNPQHIAFPVETLRIDLYAYLSPGTVMFDNIVLKAVGKQTRIAKDDAIKKPVTRPAREGD
jgi:hypothetical protein